MDLFELVQVIILTITLLVLIQNLITLRKQLKDQHEWYRREASIKYSGLFHPKVKECRIELDNEFQIFTREDAIPIDTINERINNKRGLRTDMNYLLTYYENIAISCFNNVADEGIIKDMMKGSIIRFRKLMSNYIDCRRKETNNPKLWSNLTQLTYKWEGIEEHNSTTREKLG